MDFILKRGALGKLRLHICVLRAGSIGTQREVEYFSHFGGQK